MDKLAGSVYSFVEPLHSRYECSICACVLHNPVQVEECGHRFCQGCIISWQGR